MGKDEKVVWSEGATVLSPRPESIGSMIGLLGRNNLDPTLSNLLNVVGGAGWELAWFNENENERVWLFKQRL